MSSSIQDDSSSLQHPEPSQFRGSPALAAVRGADVLEQAVPLFASNDFELGSRDSTVLDYPEVPVDSEGGGDGALETAADADMLPEDDLGIPEHANLAELNISLGFIKELQNATLDNDKIADHVREQLRNPLRAPQELDSLLELSLNIFLGMDNTGTKIYETVKRSNEKYSEDISMLSYHEVQKAAEKLSGVSPIYDDMCEDSCAAFTGPFKEHLKCPLCNKDRYKWVYKTAGSNTRTREPIRQALTIPLGPQLQALFRTPAGAEGMRYRRELTAKILAQLDMQGDQWKSPDMLHDYLHSTEYLEAVQRGDIKDTDIILLLSLDGAQLYAYKASDCWIYLWVVLEHSPDVRYRKKHVLIGGIIPGPNKPQNVDSFLFSGLHHLSALMRDGLQMWDAKENKTYLSRPFLALVTADGPGMTYLNGAVGHQGACGCRLYCGQRGRLKPNSTTYYPASKRPDDYDTPGSDHGDVSHRTPRQPGDSRPQDEASLRYRNNLQFLLASKTQAEYKRRRLQTGLAKPSIFLGLPSSRMFPLPGCFPADIMHLVALNLPDLLIKLWRGTLDCDRDDDKSTWDWVCLTGDVWKAHGQAVSETRQYLPSFFHRPPRNPAEKMTSGYKAVEWLTYLFGLGPAFLHGILPDKYWKNYCKLVRGIRLLHQRHISLSDIREAHRLLIEFVDEYEDLYYARKKERLHFIRQSIHALLHMAPETIRVGPYIIFAQWVMERLIGQLMSELRQPSNTWGNLEVRALRRAQVSALKVLHPEMQVHDKEAKSVPRGALNLPEDYTLLRAAEPKAHTVSDAERQAIQEFFARFSGDVSAEWIDQPWIAYWGRLLLPNGLIARSVWKEERVRLARMARNVKVRTRYNLF